MNRGSILPVLVSVPHGGLLVPPEVRAFCRLDLPAMLEDGDTWAGRVYDLEGRVKDYHLFLPARAILDPNRAPADLPPGNPDGVVKSETVSGTKIWRNPRGLDAGRIEELMLRYYRPYHEKLAEAAQKPGLLLALDCHTMLDRAPHTAPVPGKKRPLICLGNRGDENGEQSGEALTAPPGLMHSFKAALEKYFKDLQDHDAAPLVTLNDPFKGGYITRKHGTASPLPWIQVEINRSLYLANPPRTTEPDPESARRIANIKNRLLAALDELF